MTSRVSGRGVRHRHREKFIAPSPSCLLLAFGTLFILLWILWTGTAVQQAHQIQTNNAAAHQLEPLPTQDELYGPAAGRWPSSAASGPSQLLVLSYYSSKASQVARLLMLMRVYAGEANQLRIDAHNKLRWWELNQLSTLNDLMLSKYASPGLPHNLGRGFHIGKLSPEDFDYYQDRMQGIVKYLNRHRPWLLKDPRMAWLAPVWLERLDTPLCVLVVNMQPQQLAQHISQQQQLTADSSSTDGQFDITSSSTHLERWTNATLSALKACNAVPTIVVPSSVLEPPLLQPFLVVLQQHLKLAGVQGTQLPPDELLQQQYMAHLHKHPAAQASMNYCGPASDPNNSTSVNDAALLQDSCKWLPPKPQTGSTGQQSGPNAEQAAVPVDASLMPVPTRALLETLHDHLSTHLAHPEPGFSYNRVSGELYSAYAKRVKQLVQQGGGGQHHGLHGDLHSIGVLVFEALKHVETTVTAAAAAPASRQTML